MSSNHIQKQGFEVQLIADPGVNELSRAVKQIVDEVFEEHGHKGEFDLALETHILKEYESPETKGRKMVPIEYSTVLEVEGVPFDEIDKVLFNINAEIAMDRILARVA